MSQRDRLFIHFGPLFLEALMNLLLTEINILRQKEGLPQYTPGQVMTALENQLSNLQTYPWMDVTSK